MKDTPAEKEREEARFKELEKTAAKGDIEAQFQLGEAYSLGFRIPDMHDGHDGKFYAAKWYQKAAEQGHVEAQYRLGYLHENDFDYKTSATWYRKAAEKGHIEAQFHLGIYYRDFHLHPTFLGSLGFFSKSHRIEAIKWFRIAAEQGHIQAQFNLGDCYERGSYDDLPSAVERLSQQRFDEAEAAKWYRKAAEQGHIKAQYRLGCRCRDGKGVPKNLVEAYKWFNLAWKNGEEEHERGREWGWEEKNVEKEREELLVLMTVEQRDAAKQFQQYYESPAERERKAAHERSKATFEANKVKAEQGDANAQFNVGECYEYSRGIPEDELLPLAQAKKWYRMAAEQGHAAAQYGLGRCYGSGTASAENFAEMLKWYHKAANQGYGSAQYSLGCCYAHGRVVPKNLVEAYKWLTLAWAQKKLSSVDEKPDKLAALMTPEQIAEAQRLAREFQPHTESADTNSN
ncbi:MAG TPA: SEL1-like repeat protein [Candidatus Sulfopaludibacter sp.]|nr:SEL1-like repeat protein [Candidatus Sulfopaludibacter sp.]